MPELRTDERNSRNRLNPTLGDAFVIPEPPAWHARRECESSDPGLFFPERRRATTEAAKAICAECPVRAKCLQSAIEGNEQYGIWGGTSEAERRPMIAAYRELLLLDAAS